MARIFSGIQPSGEMHIGNWLGAIRNWVALQHDHDALYCIVDQHAITGKYDTTSFADRTRAMAISLIASGLDTDRSPLFLQSHVPEHTELAWLLTTIAPVGELERMTQYKDKSKRFESIPAGLLCYPILMAADILLYRAGLVPVGDDQLQHLELARELARRWNAAFSPDEPFLIEPEGKMGEAKRIIGLDGKAKMSKSLGNTVGVMESPEDIWDKLRTAMTDPARVKKSDPGNPEICNVYSLHGYFSPEETVVEVANKCRTASWGCIECKRVLSENMSTKLAPIREKALELEAHPEVVDEILADGASRARAIAKETMIEVRQRMGFLPGNQ